MTYIYIYIYIVVNFVGLRKTRRQVRRSAIDIDIMAAANVFV